MAIQLWRLYKSSRADVPELQTITLEELMAENEDHPEFVDLVTKAVAQDAFYDDSDYNEGVICWYLASTFVPPPVEDR